MMKSSKEQLYALLGYISDLLYSPKYAELNRSNRVDLDKITGRFDYARNRLNKLPEDIILENEDYLPTDIYKAWKRFDAAFDGKVTEQVKKSYGILIKRTSSFLEYLKSLPGEQNGRRTAYNARSISVEDEKEKRARLKKQYDMLRESIARERNTGNPDAGEMEALRKQLDAVAGEMKKVQDKVESAEADRKTEARWTDRIELAFKDLGNYTRSIEDEKDKATAEYWSFLIITWILAALFCRFYYLFIKGVQSHDILLNTWLDYLPYGMMIPLYGLLIWLCVYQKNRAHKISIELTTRLFNIHYLEGLLKLTNTLSANPDEAIGKIDHAVDSMLRSYLKQVDRNQLSETELSRMEAKEMESNPYWKLLQEIKELIKTIRQ